MNRQELASWFERMTGNEETRAVFTAEEGRIIIDALREAPPTEALRSGWIPVGERLPKDWVPVLVHVPEKRPGIRDTGQTVAIAHRYGEDKDYGPAGWTISSIVWGDSKGEITHWMPLPSLPSPLATHEPTEVERAIMYSEGHGPQGGGNG